MKKLFALLLALILTIVSCCCFAEEAASASDKEAIEAALNLANNPDQEWTYNSGADAWVLSVVIAVTNPVIENEEGVSVCVPGAYVKGIDTDGDGEADVTAATAMEAVKGSLVIDYEATITSTNGQTYTAATAPVILNTGAAGYGNSSNTTAATTYAAQGYINVACGNRGKQDSYTDAEGNTVYTGDAPSCLVDQKAAARYVKYNILLGNLPGSVDYWVSTGGSGGGAHAAMFAATSNNPDFYDYQIEVGAVGVYRNEDGSYCTTVTINGEEVELSDGAWGCVAYSAITSLYEADMALAMEYTLNTSFSFNTDFQQAMAGLLSQEYMAYINAQNLTVEEAKVGFDLDGDGELNSTIALTIEYDEEKYADTNGYGGSYLDLYLAELTENLQWYVDNLDYAEGWTWFGSDGVALTDEELAAMTTADKAQAFIEGRYAKGSSGSSMGGPGGDMSGGPGGNPPDGGHGGPGGTTPDGGMGGPGNGEMPSAMGKMPSDGEAPSDLSEGLAESDTAERSFDNTDVAENSSGDEMDVGTPDAGTTQAAGSSTNSNNYSSYAEMLAAYEADVAEIAAGDAYGRNITAATSEIAQAHDAVLAVNGDYYGARERGYVIRNGVVYRDTADDADVCCIYADGSMEIVSADDYTAQELADAGVWQAFSFGPALVEDGVVQVDANDEVGRAKASNPRTAIAVLGANRYLLVVSDGRTDESEGLSLKELADFLQSLGAETAYNLDGGGSSTMVFLGEVINNPTTTGNSIKERSVSDIVYFS